LLGEGAKPAFAAAATSCCIEATGALKVTADVTTGQQTECKQQFIPSAAITENLSLHGGLIAPAGTHIAARSTKAAAPVAQCSKDG
jgi:hypothetical protein